MTTTIQNQITTAAAGWLPFGIVPCEAAVIDRGPRSAGGRRFAVELSHARGKTAADAITLAEVATAAAAAKLAAETETVLDQLCAAHRRRLAG
jgi:hypothetical protein